jgi:hypothetical protein
MTAPAKCVPGFDLGADDAPTPSIPKPAPKPASETVTLRGVPVPLTSDVGGAFVTDCARNRERLFNDDQIREKYDITPDAWVEITKNKSLRLAITRECERRMLNNDAAREAAAKQFTKAPEVLGGILEDQKASPRHRIEAAKELVTINLGNAPEDKLVFDCGVPRQNKETTDAERDW